MAHPSHPRPVFPLRLTDGAAAWQAYCESLQTGGLIASVAEEGEE